MPLTIYSFGYWGWGNHTERLIEAVDAVEEHRGFRPPLFVDIRIHRVVRAKGFQGDAFEHTVGKRRHVWMPDLGNLSVLPNHKDDRICIKRPAAAAELLDLARENARNNRHVIFFCSCIFPRWCHRHVVAKLLLREARRRNLALTVTEWPGGEPSSRALQLQGLPYRVPKAPRLPLRSTRPLWRYASLPDGALVTIGTGSDATVLPVSSVRRAPNGWYLPVLLEREGAFLKSTPRAANVYRREVGLGDWRVKCL